MPPEPKRSGRLRSYRRLFAYAVPYRRGWAAIVVATLSTTALSLAQPWPLKILVDHVLGQRPLEGWTGAVLARLPGTATASGLLAWLVVAGLVIFVVNSALEVAISLGWTRVGRRMVYRLSQDLFARAQRRSLAAHTHHTVGDTMGRITVDAWCVHAVVDTLCMAPGHALLTTAVMVAVMLQLDARLTLLALGVAPCMAAAAWLFRRPMRDAAHARRDVESRLQAHVHQTLTSVPVVQAFGREDEEQHRFQELTSAAIRAHQRGAFVGSAYALGSGLVTTVGTALVMWYAAMRVLDGRLTIGTALVFLAYLASLQWQLSAFAKMYTALQTAGAGVDRVMAMLDADDDIPELQDATPLTSVRGEVRFEHVDFAYRADAPVLRDVSLTAHVGDVVAVVGPTGVGKSSLVGLIPRFIDPTAGQVLIDGRDVRTVSLASLRQQVAIVLQEPFLFPTSVAENIALGRPDASRAAIERAAQAANAHDFITALPQGYDTVLGERGGSLSGGERQRIAIARALLKNAPILILDEPTSALDADTEHAVVEALERLIRGRTTFIVAHRLSTIRRATTILVLHEGRVIEHGSHAALLAGNGPYRRLHDLQFAVPSGEKGGVVSANAVSVASPAVEGGAAHGLLWLVRYPLRRWPALLGVLATMVAKVGVDLLKPWPLKVLVDHGLSAHPLTPALAGMLATLPGDGSREALIGWSVAATIVLFVLGWALSVATAYTNIGFGQRMIYDLATDLFSHLQRLSLRFHSRRSVGDSIRRVTTDCGCVSVIVKDAVLPFVAALVSFAAMFVVMWRLEPRLTLVSLAVAPWLVLVLHRYMTPMLERSYAQQEAEARIYEVLERSLSALPAVQAFNQEPAGDRAFARATEQVVDASVASAVIGLKFKVLIGLGTACGTAAIVWLGAQSVLDGRLTVGGILVFLAYLTALYGPLETLMYAPSTTQGAAGSARRVLEILDTRRDVDDRPGARPLSRPQGHLKVEHVSFGYEPGRPVLHDISFEVRPGETVAIIGATGAGKSTLASLVPRFYDAWTGRVTVDGHDVRDLQLKNLRAHVSVVLQEPFLLPMTIAENIAYGRPNASYGDIEAAARAANAHDFIMRLPDGYATVLAERGATLSGGERQRLSVARAILKDAPILILDEPTSAIDSHTESQLLGALERLMEGRATIVIAHRMSTIAKADRIVALEHGRVVEQGSPAALLQQGGVYARFHGRQSASGAVDGEA